MRGWQIAVIIAVVVAAVAAGIGLLISLISLDRVNHQCSDGGSSSGGSECPGNPVPAPTLPDKRVRVVVVGGGMGGHHSMYELWRAGIGSASKPGASGNTGLMLVEKTADPCGIIRPITFYPESSPNADVEAINDPYDPSYQPYRWSPHANFVNLLTEPGLRCLANELRLPLQMIVDDGKEIISNGIVSHNSRFNQGRDGSSASVFGDDNGCGTLNGFGCMIRQLNPGHRANAYNIFTIPEGGVGDIFFGIVDPDTNETGYLYDPLDFAISWFLGYPGAPNPTYNYSGDGTTYQGGAVYFDPDNSAQDHPRWKCATYKDTGALLQHYLGNEYAQALVDVYFGFRGDFLAGTDACSYFGRGLADGFNSRDWLSGDVFVPVGGMSEFCTRERHHVQHDTLGTGVAATYALSEPALVVAHTTGADTAKGKYLVQTTKRRIFADEVVLNLPPSAIRELSGDVAAALQADPHLAYPKARKTITAMIKWTGSAGDWILDFMSDKWFSYTRIDTASCLNRFTIFRSPYTSNSDMHAIRVVYTDEQCQGLWEALLALDNPAFQTAPISPATGYPLGGAVAKEIMRQLRTILAASNGPNANATIPDPAYVYMDWEPNGWFYGTPGTPYSLQQEFAWAKRPLGTSERVMLAQQAYVTFHSGQSYSAVNLTREALIDMFGSAYSTRAALVNRTTCGVFVDDLTVTEYSLSDGALWVGADSQGGNLLDNEVAPYQLVTDAPRSSYADTDQMGTDPYVWQLA